MSFTLILNTETVKHDWDILRKPRNYKLASDRVYSYVRHKCLKYNKNATDMSIYIGKDIADLINVSHGGRVDVYFDKNNTNFVKIKRTTGVNGYKIMLSHKAETLFFKFRCPSHITLKPYDTVEMDFDIFNDNSILIDLKSVRR